MITMVGGDSETILGFDYGHLRPPYYASKGKSDDHIAVVRVEDNGTQQVLCSRLVGCSFQRRVSCTIIGSWPSWVVIRSAMSGPILRRLR